jgi:ABC-type sugar transport system ATPase subunit
MECIALDVERFHLGLLDSDALLIGPLVERVLDREAGFRRRSADQFDGIRPEHIKLDDSGLKAEVVVVEPMGSETQVVVRCGGQSLTCVFRERITAKPGESIGITPDTNVTHLFDASTGWRL